MDSSAIDPPKARGRRRDVAAEVALARHALRTAQAAVDMAVAALPDIEATATPTLLLLLSSAVRATQDLIELEAQLARQTAGGIKT